MGRDRPSELHPECIRTKQEGKAELDNFIDPESTYPVIATTSELMSTGVDAQTCKLILLDQSIQSMTKFTQIIGRGTRTNIVLNTRLVETATKMTGLKTRRELVDYAFRELVRQVVNKLNEIDFNRAADRHTFKDIKAATLDPTSVPHGRAR